MTDLADENHLSHKEFASKLTIDEKDVDLNRVSMVLCTIEKDGKAECEIHDYHLNYFTVKNITSIDSDARLGFERGTFYPKPFLNIIGQEENVSVHKDKVFLMRVKKIKRPSGDFLLTIENSKESMLYDYERETIIPQLLRGD